MAILTRMRRRKMCYFFIIPNELLLMVSKHLSLGDLISLADTCMACRSLLSDVQCIEACTRAGLSIPLDVKPRAMAKLLCQPRVGVSNWSFEGGRPKASLDFSNVWSISSAVRDAVNVDLHPTFAAHTCASLCEQQSFEQVSLRVTKDQSHILLEKHRLYLHEYATSPPLRELRVVILDDEGPIVWHDVAFRIRNSSGVTLGNYYQGFYKFLSQRPSLNVLLTQEIMQLYNDVYAHEVDPLLHGEIKNIEDSQSEFNPYFIRHCPTNLDMMDTWTAECCNTARFSQRPICCPLPLYRGSGLSLELHFSDLDEWEDTPYMQRLEDRIRWGEPLRFYKSQDVSFPDPPCEDPNKECWDFSPVIDF